MYLHLVPSLKERHNFCSRLYTVYALVRLLLNSFRCMSGKCRLARHSITQAWSSSIQIYFDIFSLSKFLLQISKKISLKTISYIFLVVLNIQTISNFRESVPGKCVVYPMHGIHYMADSAMPGVTKRLLLEDFNCKWYGFYLNKLWRYDISVCNVFIYE